MAHRDGAAAATRDVYFMDLALLEARTALAAGDYPVGAVLTVDGELWATGRNALYSEGRSTAHAEFRLFYEHSARLRPLIWQTPRPALCLYTTLEPCLMCLGTTIMHRIGRLVIACPDPHGGSVSLDLASVGSFYGLNWPQIHFLTGRPRLDSWELLMTFLRTEKFHSWREMVAGFAALRAGWT